MAGIRQPVVAGAFYPADPAQLRGAIQSFLEQARLQNDYANAFGVLSPHAGYVYSGLGAAYAFNALMNRKVERLVVLAPSHRVGGYAYSVGDYEAYRTPLGDMPVDSDAVRELLMHSGFAFHPTAHSGEHSLEVQVPFAQVCLPDAKLVPIVMGDQTADNARKLAKSLLAVFGDEIDRTAFVASSDLSHYHDAETATHLDKRFISHVEALDAEGLLADTGARRCEACGFGGALTLMYMSQALGDAAYDTLVRFHSGDVSGDNRQVVGYTAGVFYRKP